MSFIETYFHIISQPVVYTTMSAVFINLSILMVWNFWVYERNINQ